MVAKGLSMERLGREIGYTSTAVCRWANGQAVPRLDALYRLAKYFGVTIDSLFDGVEDER
jgi:transcriptional regulator with XRE-family HTH domain